LADQSKEGRDMRGYWAILRRWLWLIVLLTVVTVGVVYVRASTAPPVFQASVTLQVIALEPEEVALYTQMRGLAGDEQIRAVRDEFVTILEGSTVAWRTVGALNLGIDANKLSDYASVRAEDEFIYIQARAIGPQAAEELASTYVNQGLEFYAKVRSLPAEVSAQFISEQLRDSQQQLAEVEQRLLDFKLKHRVDSLHPEISALHNIMRTLEQDRDEARVERERALAVWREMRASAAAALADAEQATAEAQDYRVTLRELQKTEAEQAELAEAGQEPEPEAVKGEDILVLIEETQEKADASDAAAQYYLGLARSLEASAASQAAMATAAGTAETEYGQIIADREAELATLIGLGAEYDALGDSLAEARSRVSFLAEKSYEAEVKKSQARSVEYLQIIEPAHAPGSPMPSNIWQKLAIGAVASLIVGTILAFLLEIAAGRRRQAKPATGQ
jgi:uncharacterized protein involved in exopolysaccharide biosynthesis